jgi:hypothetical protein
VARLADRSNFGDAFDSRQAGNLVVAGG